MNYQLKSSLDTFMEFCDLFDRKGFGQQLGADIRIRDAANLGFLQFLMYLSASDGNIDWNEAKFLGDYLDFDGLTPDFINKQIRENNIYSTEFESTVPISLKIIVAIDNFLYENDMGDGDTHLPNLLVSVFEELGREFLECDGAVSGNEESDLDTYLSTLKDFVSEKSVRPAKTLYTSVNYKGQRVPLSVSFSIGKAYISDDDE